MVKRLLVERILIGIETDLAALRRLADFSFFADRIRAYLDSAGGGP